MPRQADVTVLLPAYNAAPYVAEAVGSILRQTYPHFTLLAMDDGSTDGTGAILDRLAAGDGRMRVVHRENRGLVPTLNEGLELCETELVARMDADDWAFPDRFRLQKAYMEAHPEIAVCGTGAVGYEDGRSLGTRSDAPFDILCLFRASFVHPTVMFRRSAVLSVGAYADDMPAAEDYDLWVRLLAEGYAMNNLPQTLLRYRLHPDASRSQYRRTAYRSTEAIWKRQLRCLGLFPSAQEMYAHRYCSAPCNDVPYRLRDATVWLKKICAQNYHAGVYDQKKLERECASLAEEFLMPLSCARHPLRYAKRALQYVLASICN